VPRVDLPSSFRGEGTLVSVIVPTYGDAEYLPTALESVAAQTHDNVEVVVVDSSGVDWLEALADDTEGVVYIYQEPRGLPAARNRGLEAASGDVIAFLDADDHWAPEKLERQLPAFERGADVVYCDAYIVDGDGQRHMTTLPVEDPEHHWLDFLYEGGVPVPTVAVRRSCLEREPFDEGLDAVEDHNLLARLFHEFTPAKVSEPLAYYHRRAESMSSDAAFIYENEVRSLKFLFERYPELESHRERLLAKARYKYGKRLVRTGRAGEARGQITRAIATGVRDSRAFVVLAVALLPCCNRRALELLEAVQETLR